MTDYGALLGEIAVPRRTGSPGNARIRGALKRELGARGFVVMEQAFPASPKALRRVATAGALLAGTAAGLAAARLAGLPGYTLIVVGLAALGATLAGLRFRRPAEPSATGTNLIAVRPRGRVATWLVAHYDTKGQPISMLTRIAAVVLAVVGLPCLAGFTATIAHPDPAPITIAWLLPGLAGGLLLSRNRATDDSPGALDNASGVVAVLAIVDRLPGDAPVGIIFPDAEEFGLQGAQALARERAHLFAGTVLINFDGIDDAGPTRALVHRAGPTARAVATALDARRAAWLPVFVDGLALRRAAAECVTILRGGWRTARVVHTPRDASSRLRLEGVGRVVEGVALVLNAGAR